MNIEMYDQCFQKILGVSKHQLENLQLGDCGWSSLPHLLLINEIENTFKVKLTYESISNFTSYKEGLNILFKTGVKFSF